MEGQSYRLRGKELEHRSHTASCGGRLERLVRPLRANGIANKAVSTALGNIVNTLRAVGATVVPVDDACIGHVPGLGRAWIYLCPTALERRGVGVEDAGSDGQAVKNTN